MYVRARARACVCVCVCVYVRTYEVYTKNQNFFEILCIFISDCP